MFPWNTNFSMWFSSLKGETFINFKNYIYLNPNLAEIHGTTWFLTINALLILKVLFFFAGKTYYGAFRRVFWRGSKNPAKCPIICFAPDKKIISRTLKSEVHWYFYVPKREREREGEAGRESERERREERGETRDKRRETRKERRETREEAIIFLNRPGQNEKSAKYWKEQYSM